VLGPVFVALFRRQLRLFELQELAPKELKKEKKRKIHTHTHKKRLKLVIHIYLHSIHVSDDVVFCVSSLI